MNLHFDFSCEGKQTRIRWSKRFSHIWGASSEVVPALSTRARFCPGFDLRVILRCENLAYNSRAIQVEQCNNLEAMQSTLPQNGKQIAGNRVDANKVLKDLHTFRQNAPSLLLITVGVRLGVSALMVKYTYWQTLACFKSRPPALKISYASLRKPVFSWKSYLC